MHRRQSLDYPSLALIWGLSFVLVLNVVQAFGWVGAVTFRALTACASLIVIAILTRRRLTFGGSWLPLAVVGATTVAGQLIGLSFATPRIWTAMATGAGPHPSPTTRFTGSTGGPTRLARCLVAPPRPCSLSRRRPTRVSIEGACVRPVTGRM